jgi:hypothetical protein
MKFALVAFALALAVPPAAFADDRDIVITTPGERSRRNAIEIGSVAAASVLFGGLGVYFNLDSRDAAASVSAHSFTHLPWTQSRQDAVDRAASSGTKAEVFYAVGGALLIGAVVALLITDPKPETTVIHPHRSEQHAPTPTVTPTPGGATLGGMWSF